MMDSPNSNNTLSVKQLLQIEEANNRLSNIQNETDIAKKNLRVISKDVSKIIKEKEYQEELLQSLSKKILVKEEELKNITISVSQIEDYIKKSTDDIKTKESRIKNKIEELKKREEDLVVLEQKNNENIEKYNKDLIQLNKDRKDIEDIHNAFSNALKTITWK